jgi:HSP20 family protein
MIVRVQRYPVLTEPFERLVDFEREIDSIFGEFLGSRYTSAGFHYPAFDLAEYENESVVVAELPGVRKEDLKITVQNGMVTISGERRQHALPEDARWIRNEIPTGQFTRSFALPHDVNQEAITAELTNGVLRVVLPKTETARAREIAVR